MKLLIYYDDHVNIIPTAQHNTTQQLLYAQTICEVFAL